MRTYTAHLHRRKRLVLVPEAFFLGALFFGPLWLLRIRRLDRSRFWWLAALFLACTVPPSDVAPAGGIRGACC